MAAACSARRMSGHGRTRLDDVLTALLRHLLYSTNAPNALQRQRRRQRLRRAEPVRGTGLRDALPAAGKRPAAILGRSFRSLRGARCTLRASRSAGTDAVGTRICSAMARLAAAAAKPAAGMAKGFGARSRAAALFVFALLSLVHSTSGTDQAPTPYAGLSSSVRPCFGHMPTRPGCLAARCLGSPTACACACARLTRGSLALTDARVARTLPRAERRRLPASGVRAAAASG